MLYYPVQSGKILTLSCSSENLVFAYVPIDLSVSIYPKDLLVKVRVSLSPHVHVYGKAIKKKVNALLMQIIPFAAFKRWKLCFIQVSVCYIDNLWAEKLQQFLWRHHHGLELLIDDPINRIDGVHDHWHVDHLTFQYAQAVHEEVLHVFRKLERHSFGQIG